MSLESREKKQQVLVVNTAQSPHALLRPVSLTSVILSDAFWTPRLEVNRRVTLPFQYEQCETTGRLNNFRRAAGTFDGPYQGMFFNDSDIYKWVEAVSWSLATHPDAETEAQINSVIDLIVAAQEESGYLNTYFTFERVPERWTNLPVMHELYCGGHMIQAAIAHHRATGSERLLAVAIRFADYIGTIFHTDGLEGACGHPEIEMALVELARETGEQRYLQQALFFINQRGNHPELLGSSDYDQNNRPLREQEEILGHAVRALYLYSGVTDIYAESGEEALNNVLETIWHNFMTRKMYITGGAGSRYESEAFGVNYELPNARAYTETCASIASLMWNWRLLLTKGEARFTDALEQVLYNGILSGVSLDGQQYFYQNPLEDDGRHRRVPWFETACCPPNVARLFASLPGYLYTTSEQGLWAHLYISNNANLTLPSGQLVAIKQESNYPWEGEITFTLQLSEPETFSLFLRIPAWAQGANIIVNGERITATIEAGSYAEVRREWHVDDKIQLTLPLAVRLYASHPHVTSNYRRIAVVRGPLVYCIEQADQPELDLDHIVLPAQPVWEVVKRSELLGGINILRTQALLDTTPVADSELYPDYVATQPSYAKVEITAIPYYAWANREAGAMRTWLPIDPYN